MKENTHRDLKHCANCGGFLLPDTTLVKGVYIHELVCVSCGRRYHQHESWSA
jgi:hypothetical protein